MHIIWGIVWIVIGVLIIKYVHGIVETFGKITWAEIHLGGGAGGTYTLWQIVGIVIILLGFLYMFGGLGFLLKPLVPLFGIGRG
jgi:hypothetical protein